MKLGPVDTWFLVAQCVMLSVLAIARRRDLGLAGAYLMLCWFASWPSFLEAVSFESTESLIVLYGVGLCFGFLHLCRSPSLWCAIWTMSHAVLCIGALFVPELNRSWFLVQNVICALQIGLVTLWALAAVLVQAIEGPKPKRSKSTRYTPTGIFSSPRAETPFKLPTQRRPPVKAPGALDFGFNGPPPSY